MSKNNIKKYGSIYNDLIYKNIIIDNSDYVKFINFIKILIERSKNSNFKLNYSKHFYPSRGRAHIYNNRIYIYIEELTVDAIEDYKSNIYFNNIVKNYFQVNSIILLLYDKTHERIFNKLNSKDGVRTLDIEALKIIRSMLENGLHKDDSALRNAVEEVIPLIEQQLNTDVTTAKAGSWVEKTSKQQSTAVTNNKKATLTLPTEAPIKWANRKTFVVSEIKDEHTRQKLETNPELEQQIRDSTDALTFFRLLYSDFGISQIDLRGGRGADAKRGLDKTLYDLLSNQLGKGLCDVLPRVRLDIDKSIEDLALKGFDENFIAKVGYAMNKRISKIR